MNPLIKPGDTVYCLIPAIPPGIDDHLFKGTVCGIISDMIAVTDNCNHTGVFLPKRVYRTHVGGLFAYWMLKNFGYAI